MLEYRHGANQALMSDLGNSTRIPVNVPADPDEVETAFSSLLERKPSVDALVVIPPSADCEENVTELSRFVTHFEKQFFLPLAGIKAVLPQMVRARHGIILMVVPASAVVICPQAPAASCAHWALRRVCQSLRAELEPFHVQIHMIVTSASTKSRSDIVATDRPETRSLSAAIARCLTPGGKPSNVDRFRDRSLHLIEQLFSDRRVWLRSTRVKSRVQSCRPAAGFRRILITGASSGLGRELACLYAGRAERLYLAARDQEALRRLREELRQMSSCTVDIAGVDFRDLQAVSNYAATVGDVDAIVNCAGFSVVGAVQDIPLELFRQNMTVNFMAPVLLTGVLLGRPCPPLHIVNVLSTAAIAGRRRQASYSASKAALWAYTRYLRQTAAVGTKVTEVLPATFVSGFAARTVTMESNGKAHQRTSSAGQNRHGLTSQMVAARIYRASLRGHRRIFIPYKSRLFHLLEAATPGLFRRLFP